MKKICIILALLVLATGISMSQPTGMRDHSLINCCREGVPDGPPGWCREMGPIKCRDMGGKPIDSCDKCKGAF